MVFDTLLYKLLDDSAIQSLIQLIVFFLFLRSFFLLFVRLEGFTVPGLVQLADEMEQHQERMQLMNKYRHLSKITAKFYSLILSTFLSGWMGLQ